MKSLQSIISVAASLAMGLAAPAFANGAADDKARAKEAALCTDAEARYVEMFDQPSAEVDDAAVVLMYKYRFCPAAISVPVGTTVRWVNVDKRTSHSVIVPGEPESVRAFPEEIIEFTFLTEGEQDYLCGPHWESHDMIGMVTVTPNP